MFFSEQILGIKLNGSHRRWFKTVGVADDGYSWKYTYVTHVAANQIGKTVGLAILILWACMYKIGTPYGTNDRELQNWLDSPYLWFHLAPSQDQAYHVLNDIRLIIKGAHPAQEVGRAKFGLKFNLPDGLVHEERVAEYYIGLRFANGAEVQFRTTDERAKAILGYRANGISVDEAAFEAHLKAIVHEVLFMRLISTNGPLFLVSTPDGINDFFELADSIRANSSVVEGDTLWLDRPNALLFSTIEDNVGYGVSREYVERMETSLDETTKEQQLRGAFLTPQSAYFTPSERIIKVFTPRLPNRLSPRAGHKYVISWDPSASSDPTAMIALDVTRQPWVGVEMIDQKRPVGIDRLLDQMWEKHRFYNGVSDGMGRRSVGTTAFDSTSMGGQMIVQFLRGMSPQITFNFGGVSRIKDDALSNLRAALLQGKLMLPETWQPVKRQLINYRREDKNIQQDLVIALAMATSAATSASGAMVARFDPHAVIAQSYGR